MGMSTRSAKRVITAAIRSDAKHHIMATIEELLDMDGGDQMGASVRPARCVSTAVISCDANATTLAIIEELFGGLLRAIGVVLEYGCDQNRRKRYHHGHDRGAA